MGLRKKLKIISGFSLLEFALTLPILLFVILATIDINTLLLTKSALHKSVATALRCIYPVDGKCIQVTGDERPKLYDYYAAPSPTGETQYLYDAFDFNGEVRFLRQPIYGFSNFRAKTLSSVRFDAKYRGPTYQLEGRYNYYVEKISLPRINGEGRSVGNQSRDPSFHVSVEDLSFASRNSTLWSPIKFTEKRADPTLTLNIGDPSESSWATAYILGVDSFLEKSAPWLPEDLRSFECFKYNRGSARDEKLSATPSDPCHGDPKRGIYSILFRLPGKLQSTTPNTCGAVALRLARFRKNESLHKIRSANIKPEKEIDLGGQRFRATSRAAYQDELNFYPRGTRPNGEDLRVPGAPLSGAEWESSYQEEVKVESGYTYAIQFQLSRSSEMDGEPCASGKIQWVAGETELFIPTYQGIVGGARGLCQDNEGKTYSTDIIPGKSKCQGEEVSDPSQNDTQASWYRYKPEEVKGQFRGGKELGIEEVALPDKNSPRPFEHACGSASNYALPSFSVEELPSPNGRIHDSRKALQSCPPDPEASSDLMAVLASNNMKPEYVETSNVSWGETSSYLPIQTQPMEPWVKASCDDPEPGFSRFPPEVRAFPESKVAWDGPLLTGYRDLHFGAETVGNPENDPKDPRVIKASNPDYQCEDFPIGTLRYDESNPLVPHTSLFKGIHANMDACGIGSILRREASQQLFPEEIRLRSNWFFEPSENFYASLEGDVETLSQCTARRIKTEESSGLGQIVAGGPFLEGELPSQCITPGSCIKLFHSFGEGEGGTIELDESFAARFGEKELYAALPWAARVGNGGKPRGTLSVQRPSEESEFVHATATAEVKLATLLGREVVLTHADKERLEIAFSK